MNNIKEALLFGKNFLRDNYIESYNIDAQIILGSVLNQEKIFLLTHEDEKIGQEEDNLYIELLLRRSQGVPVAYLTGEKEFMSLPFYVDENVLIPRPDTEILAEYLIDFIKKNNFKTGLEIGVGSGAISVSVCKYCKEIHVTACDISEKAVLISQKNAETNGVSDRLKIIKSDLFSEIPPFKYDIIFSNPPYISDPHMKELPIDVRSEPELALYGGSDGLDFYRAITEKSVDFLAPNGVIAYEIGFDQATALKNILASFNFTDIEIIKDLSGFDRVVTAKYKERFYA